MRRASDCRMGQPFRVGVSLGLALCLTLDVYTAVSSATAKTNRLSAAAKTAPIAPPDRSAAAMLDRIAYAVEGAQSDHATHPLIWGPEPKRTQGPMHVSADAH